MGISERIVLISKKNAKCNSKTSCVGNIDLKITEKSGYRFAGIPINYHSADYCTAFSSL